MKKIFLLLASVALFGASCQSGASSTAASSDSTAVAPTGAIAFVRYDSLISQYDMYNDLRASYEEKVGKAESEITSKGRSLERAMMSFQEKVQNGLMTRSQAQTEGERLQQREQNFMQEREVMMGELAEEEQVMLNRIQYSIDQFLAEFNKDYRYSFILSTTGNMPILSANPAHDITAEVVEGLNKAYAADANLGVEQSESAAEEGAAAQ